MADKYFAWRPGFCARRARALPALAHAGRQEPGFQEPNLFLRLSYHVFRFPVIVTSHYASFYKKIFCDVISVVSAYIYLKAAIGLYNVVSVAKFEVTEQ